MCTRASLILRYVCLAGILLMAISTAFCQKEVLKEIDSLFHFQEELMAEQKFSEAMSLLDSISKILRSQVREEGLVHARLANSRGKIYEKNAAYSKAEVEYRKALDIQQSILGEEHLDYAESINNLGISLMFQERFGEARESYQKAGDIRKKILGADHPDYARSLNNVANTFLYQGDFTQAEKYYLKANEIRMHSTGPDTEQYAGTLMNLASLYLYQNRVKKAEDYIHQACSTYRTILGNDHIKYAICLSNLGNVQNSLAEFDLSADNFRKAEKIFQRHLPADHPDLLRCKEGQIASYQHKGYLELYRDKTLEILELRRQTLGEDHSEYLNSLSNLINIQMQLGELDKCEQYIDQLISTRIRNLGERHPQTLEARILQSSLLSGIGDFQSAVDIDEEVISTYKTIEGTSPLVLAGYYDRLGLHLLNNLQFARADSFCRLAVDIFVQHEDGEIYNLMQSMDHLAIANTRLEKYSEAKTWHENAIRLSSKHFGQWAPVTLTKKADLLKMYHRSGDLSEVDSLVTSIKTYLEQKNDVDIETRDYLISVLLAHFQITKDFSSVHHYAKELYHTQVERLNKRFSHLSDAERENFIQYQLGPFAGMIASLAAQVKSDEMNTILYDMTLVMKGAQLRTSKNTLLYILHQEDEDSYVYYAKLMSVRRELSNAYVDPEFDPVRLRKLEDRQAELEKELARRSAEYRLHADNKGLTCQEVQEQLQAGEAAVEFILYPEEADRASTVYRYGALVLRGDDPGNTFVDLCAERDLEAILSSGSDDSNHHLASMYVSRGLKPVKNNAPSRALYSVIFQPLQQALSSIQTIYYSPVGLIHRINLGAIPLDSQTYAMEKYQFNRLSSTSILVRGDEDKNTLKEKKAMVLGGIDYDMEIVEDSDTATMDLEREEHQDPLLAAVNRGKVGISGWSFLKGTLQESEQISLILQSAEFDCTLLSGKQATEERIKSEGKTGKAGRVLHVASHGYFFPDPVNLRMPNQHQFSMADHPMVRSGLILSGANRVWMGAPQIKGKEDGVLTAFEISQLNLTHTELVVLSACETGLGDIRGEEGVYGLQRAFKMAGVRYLIMSLWQVPDQPTKDFMVTFYQHWLENKLTIPEAFRKTQLEMRDRFFDAYNWAGFVLVE
ncbi:MAG: CHAT domain-containing protein [Saprospiraceae bacterium]|nr:CHAT domain-containing protein [Saprospiraceae bacterium]